jgi:hypothetical protein
MILQLPGRELKIKHWMYHEQQNSLRWGKNIEWRCSRTGS